MERIVTENRYFSTIDRFRVLGHHTYMNSKAYLVHTFQERGLGIAPFHFVRSYESKYCACPGAPVQPGTCCDYCGTGIMQVYVIADVNGKEFKVGCECVKKTADAGLIDVVKREVARRKREVKNNLRIARQTRLRELFATPKVKEAFTARKHPNAYFASQGKTYADYVEYMLCYGGDSIKDDILVSMEAL